MADSSIKETTRLLLKGVIDEEALIEEILSLGRAKKVSEYSTVISPNQNAQEMPFVVSGVLRVMRHDENGNEVFLYYLEGGQTCAMSITCCLEEEKSAFHVVAEEDSTLWLMPTTYLDSWIEKYPSFRRFVMRSYQKRFDELLTTLDSMVFMHLDKRVYKYLLDKKQASGTYEINKTHQQIANELNTSRVVISRVLKKLEKEEKIEQHRNKIEVL